MKEPTSEGMTIGGLTINSQIRNVGIDTVLMEVVSYLTKCITALGIEMSKQQLRLMASDVIDRYGFDSLEDVRDALKKGRRGLYGYGHNRRDTMNMLVFSEWMDKHLEEKSQVRYDQAKKIPEERQLKRPPMNKDQAETYWQESKADYLKSGRLIGGVNLFRIGVRLGHIDITDEWFTNEVKEETAQWFQAELERVKMLGGIVERDRVNELKRVIEATMEQRSDMGIWQAQCKRQAVRKVFESIGE